MVAKHLARAARERAKAKYPELKYANAEKVFEVDRLRRSEGRRPTSLGLATEASWLANSQLRPQIDELRARSSERRRSFHEQTVAPIDASAPRSPLSDLGLLRQAEDLYVRPDAANASPFRQQEFEAGTAALERNRRAQGVTDQTEVTGGLAVAGGVGSLIDRFTGAPIRGALQDPNPIRGALRGFYEPDVYARARELPGINRLPDDDLYGERRFMPDNLSIRDIGAGVADAALDVGTVAGVPADAARFGARAARPAVRGVNEALNESALRQADPRAYEFGRRPYEDVIPRATVVDPRQAPSRVRPREGLPEDARVLPADQALAEHPLPAGARDSFAQYAEFEGIAETALTRTQGRARELIDVYRHSSGRGGQPLRAAAEFNSRTFAHVRRAGEPVRAYLRRISDDGQTVMLYRGQGREPTLAPRSLQSYSLHPDIARRYAREGADPSGVLTPPHVIARRVPIDDIVAGVPSNQGEVLIRETSASPEFAFRQGFPFGGLSGGADEALTPYDSAVQKLRDLLNVEANLRRRGLPQQEIAARRSQQSARIGQAADLAARGGMSIEEAADLARAGARTGPQRQTFAAPLELTPEENAALVGRIAELQQAGEITPYEYLNATLRLHQLMVEGGQRLQPAQRRLLSRVIGEDVVEALERRPPSEDAISRRETVQWQREAAQAHTRAIAARRRAETAEARSQEAFDKADRAEMGRIQASYERTLAAQARRADREQTAATIREQAERARQLGDEIEGSGPIEARARLQAAREGKPTTDVPGLTTQALRARRRAIDQFNKADRAELDSIEASYRETNARRERLEARQARGATIREQRERARALGDEIEGMDPISVRARLAAARQPDQRPFRAPDAPDAGIARPDTQPRGIPTDKLREGSRARLGGFAERERLLERMPNEEMLLNRAREIARTTGLPEIEETIGQYLRLNRLLLEGIGDKRTVFDQARAFAAGELTDPWLNAHFQRRSALKNALYVQGLNDEMIDAITDPLFNAELQTRYGVERVFEENGEVVQQLPRQAREALRPTEGNIDQRVEILDTYVQRSKNTMFGLWDFGVLMTQGRALLDRGGLPFLLGLTNRMASSLGHPLLPTIYADTFLSRQVMYALDGVPQNILTGSIQDTSAGSLLRYFTVIPGVGKLDELYTRAAEANSRFQFGTIMTAARNTAYEGDLLMRHYLGRDITNPRVRLAAARNANISSSFSVLSPRRGRNAAERILQISPSMMRSRFAHTEQMLRAVLDPKRSIDDRITGASMIVSGVLYWMAFVKGIDALFGTGDSENDPTKPGFGLVTLRYQDDQGRNYVVDMKPQDSVISAFLRSTRFLAENEPTRAAQAAGSVFIGPATPPSRAVLSVARTGYEPGAGYRFGDQTLQSAITQQFPLPPVFSRALYDGADPVSLGLEAFALSTFPESASRATERLTGLTGPRAQQALAESGDLERITNQREQELRELAGRGDRKSSALLISFDTRDRLAELAAAAGTDRQGYREGRSAILERASGRREEYRDIFESFGTSDDPVEKDAAAWYDLFGQAIGPGGLPDYERLEELEAKYADEIGADRFAAVMGLVNAIDPRDNPMEQEYQQARQRIEDAGFFELRDETWRMVREAYPWVGDHDSYYAWYRAEVDTVEGLLLEQGRDRRTARADAELLVSGMDPAKAQTSGVSAMRDMWMIDQLNAGNIDAVGDALAWGYLDGQARRDLFNEFIAP